MSIRPPSNLKSKTFLVTGGASFIGSHVTDALIARGGFGICDFVPPEIALRRYFTADEMVYAKDEKDWFDKIDYYLKHDAEREEIKKKGTARALRDHMYTNRVKDILKKLNISS